MADELESPSSGNFSIQDTMEMGLGNQELLTNLFSPETITTKTDDVQDLKKEEKKPVEKPKKEAPKEAPKVDTSKSLTSFLSDEDPEDEAPEKKNEEDEEKKEVEETPKGNNFTALAKDLYKLGVFSQEEEGDEVEITSPEQFLDRFNQEKKKGAIETINKFIGQFGEDFQEAFDAIYVKGVNPREYFNTYNKIEDFSTLDLKDEGNQIAVLKQALINQGLEGEDIAKEIERIKNYGDLESVATIHHKVLVKNEVAKLAQLEKESQTKLQQQAVVKNQYVKNVNTVLQDRLKNKEFDGIPLNPKIAAELQDFLVTDKYKTPTGETLTEFDVTILNLKKPENHEKKVKFALLLKLLEKDPTLSTIQKAGVTKKTDALFGELARHTGKSSSKSEKSEQTKSWF
jgi:hypothetical protein